MEAKQLTETTPSTLRHDDAPAGAAPGNRSPSNPLEVLPEVEPDEDSNPVAWSNGSSDEILASGIPRMLKIAPELVLVAPVRLPREVVTGASAEVTGVSADVTGLKAVVNELVRLLAADTTGVTTGSRLSPTGTAAVEIAPTVEPSRLPVAVVTGLMAVDKAVATGVTTELTAEATGATTCPDACATGPTTPVPTEDSVLVAPAATPDTTGCKTAVAPLATGSITRLAAVWVTGSSTAAVLEATGATTAPVAEATGADTPLTRLPTAWVTTEIGLLILLTPAPATFASCPAADATGASAEPSVLPA
ncbi:hypothetical protein ACYJW8_11020 [Frateuria aurantia]